MGELLCSKGAIPSSMSSCSSQIPCPHTIHKFLVGVKRSSVKTRTPFLGKSVFCHRRNSERYSRDPQGHLLKCDLLIRESIQLPRDFLGSRLGICGRACGNLAKERVVVAQLRGLLVCNAHEVPMDGHLLSGDLFGPPSSLLIAKKGIKIGSPFSEVFLTQNPQASTRSATVSRYSTNSQIYDGFKNKFRAEYNLGPPAQPLIKLPFRGEAGKLKRISLLYNPASHIGSIEKRRVIVHSSKSKPWWKRFLFQQLNEEDFYFNAEDGPERGSDGEDDEFAEDASFGAEENLEEDDVDALLSDDEKFRSWQQKRYAIDELREYQETGRDPDNRDWEDWLDESWGAGYSEYLNVKDGGWYAEQPDWEKGGMPRDPPTKPERGMNRTMKELLLRIFETQEEAEDDLNFEERVFRFTSQSTAKFVTILILVPWAVDFVVHDYVLLPFLRRWVEEVPLAAEVLEVKKSQKLHMIERLKLERQRVRFEAEIGKAPPLSDEELNVHIREEALELREELREENRSAFANLLSDAVAGFTFFLLLVFNPRRVAIMSMTGDRLFTNISDTGKAFMIILCTDIFLGYHSESGWETVIEILLDHYGLEASQGSIYIFVAIVPVTIDACFKLWVFRYLTRLSPSAAATFREMKRH